MISILHFISHNRCTHNSSHNQRGKKLSMFGMLYYHELLLEN